MVSRWRWRIFISPLFCLFKSLLCFAIFVSVVCSYGAGRCCAYIYRFVDLSAFVPNFAKSLSRNFTEDRRSPRFIDYCRCGRDCKEGLGEQLVEIVFKNLLPRKFNIMIFGWRWGLSVIVARTCSCYRGWVSTKRHSGSLRGCCGTILWWLVCRNCYMVYFPIWICGWIAI